MPRWLAIAILVVTLPASLFYLFVVPMMAATITPISSWFVWFGAFMLAQLFGLVALAALEAAGSFYGFIPRLPKPFTILSKSEHAAKHLHPVGGIMMMFVSYLAFIYAFGVLFAYLSSINHAAFSTKLGGIDAVYFSVVTAATVGYGDVTPDSAFAKALVSAEILISLLYVVLLFSAAATALQRKSVPPAHGDGSPPTAARSQTGSAASIAAPACEPSAPPRADHASV